MTPYQKEQFINLLAASIKRLRKDRSNGYVVEFEAGYRTALKATLNLFESGTESLDWDAASYAAASKQNKE